MNNFFEDWRPHRGLTYEAYQAAWAEKIQQSLARLDKKQRRYLYYARYNKARSERVHQAYEVSAKLLFPLSPFPHLA